MDSEAAQRVGGFKEQFPKPTQLDEPQRSFVSERNHTRAPLCVDGANSLAGANKLLAENNMVPSEGRT